MPARRIDTHHHFVPPFYRDWLAAQGRDAGGLPIPGWSVADDLALMDHNQIEAAILAISTPGVEGGDLTEAREMARRLNEYGAELVRDHPDRYGLFATLTLPDVPGALAEIAYAYDVLAVDGVVLHANSGGLYLGDERFVEVMDELDRRHAVAFVHPAALSEPGVPGVPAFAADFLLDTVRAALSLAKSGTLERCPHIRFILSHGGGFLPYAAARMAPILSGGSLQRGLDLLRSFYFDTALASSPFSLPSLTAFAHPDHIVFGCDWPYAPSQGVEMFISMLEAQQGMDLDAVNWANASRLLPRFHRPSTEHPTTSLTAEENS